MIKSIILASMASLTLTPSAQAFGLGNLVDLVAPVPIHSIQSQPTRTYDSPDWMSDTDIDQETQVHTQSGRSTQSQTQGTGGTTIIIRGDGNVLQLDQDTINHNGSSNHNGVRVIHD